MSEKTGGGGDPALVRLIDGLTQGLNVLGSLLIVALMVLVGLDVLGRNLANAPIKGVPEIVTLSIVAIVFLQIPQALRMGRMTRSDAVLGMITRRSPKIGRAFETLFDLAGALVIGLIVWSTWPLLVRAWSRGDFIGAIGEFTAPTWPVKAIIVLGGATLIAQFLLNIWRRYS